MDTIMQLAGMLGPAVAAYVSVKVGISHAITTAEHALKEAQRANDRLDSMFIERRRAHHA